MMQVMEYVVQHYALFLGGIILILLAVIGYYADKTNFGQGKLQENNDKNKIKDIDNMRLSDVVGDNNTNNPQQLETETFEKADEHSDVIGSKETIQQSDNEINNLSNNDMNDDNIFITNTINQDNNLDSNVDLVSSEINIEEQPLNIETLEQKNNSLLNEEVFDKFNQEFNSILPEKELINTDLLSDIDDLELGKTQRLDFTNVPDLDDIELPKIKQLVSDEQDIWKF